MLRDLIRFNKLATQIAESGAETQLMQPLEEFFANESFQHRVQRLVFAADAGLHLELPDLSNAAIPSRYHGAVLS